jgi:hypothetical protein
MQQPPGPRESPQVEGLAPHAAVAGAPEWGAPGAKTENCCARFRPWQLGHAAWREPMISASKGWLQSLQMYSKMGMVNCVCTGKNAQLFCFVTSFIISVHA